MKKSWQDWLLVIELDAEHPRGFQSICYQISFAYSIRY